MCSDGRIKPDVVAPGFKVVSALAGGRSGGDKFCGVYETFGTSMATPVVAGSALLLRDYFLNVWSSVCSPLYAYCTSFLPSGYLLKAIIIHSAQAVEEYSESAFDSKTDIASHTLASPPDSVQGYGSVNLHAIIPMSSGERKAQDLYVADAFAISGRQSATLQVSVKSGKKPLRVTLLWYDRASVVGNSQNLLIINLDLTVTSPSGNTYYGNGVNGDSVNPQEQVFIGSPQQGTYIVTVSNMGSYSANLALVVTCHGSVEKELSLGFGAVLNSADLKRTDHSLALENLRQNFPDDWVSRSTESTENAFSLTNFDWVKSLTIHHELSANQKVLLKSFELTDESLELFSIDLTLDARYCSGSEAFIFAVIVEAPNGEIVQIGGYNQYSSLDRIWQRMSPVQWTASSAPADGGMYWRSTRYVVDFQLAQMGPYEVYISLMHDSWESTTYYGNVKLNFVDAATALQRSKSNAGFFSSLGAVTAGFIICVLAGTVVFGVAIVLKKRKNLSQMSSFRLPSSSSSSNDATIKLRKQKDKKAAKNKRTPRYETVGKDEVRNHVLVTIVDVC